MSVFFGMKKRCFDKFCERESVFILVYVSLEMVERFYLCIYI